MFMLVMLALGEGDRASVREVIESDKLGIRAADKAVGRHPPDDDPIQRIE
jgi:hypothetical protein